MSRFIIRVAQYFLPVASVVTIWMPYSIFALEHQASHAVTKMTCFTFEESSNEFGTVQINFQTNEVRVTFYIAGMDNNSLTRVITEYDENVIANLEKAGSCYPVHKKQIVQGIIKNIEFADGCLVRDPHRAVYSSDILYKIDFTRQSGMMHVKSYGWDTSLYAERKYVFYQCFESGD